VHHTVVITGLAQSTTYYYSVGDSAGGFSDVFSFTTAKGQSHNSFSVVRCPARARVCASAARASCANMPCARVQCV
jgi:hypothetical protein